MKLIHESIWPSKTPVCLWMINKIPCFYVTDKASDPRIHHNLENYKIMRSIQQPLLQSTDMFVSCSWTRTNNKPEQTGERSQSDLEWNVYWNPSIFQKHTRFYPWKNNIFWRLSLLYLTPSCVQHVFILSIGNYFWAKLFGLKLCAKDKLEPNGVEAKTWPWTSTIYYPRIVCGKFKAIK